MAPGADASGARAQHTKHWEHVAAGWATWLEWTERNFEPVTAWMSEAAGWAPGLRVLDVGCGAGFPAKVAAERLRPGGTVVATDLSPAMVARTAEAARAAGLDNLESVQMDAEDLRFDEGTFDAVTNAYGLMFCPEPVAAVREACRVLKPGGRLAAVTWAPPAVNPFFTTMLIAAAPFLDLPAPSPGVGPFRLASVTELEDLLRTAGMTRVCVEAISSIFECASVADYRQLFCDVALRARVDRLDADARARFERAVEEAVEPFVQHGRVRLLATSLCAAGQKIQRTRTA